jgi:DNA-binding MurR/RpiR family transcriptional regulator
MAVDERKSLKKEIEAALGTYTRLQKKLAVFMVERWDELPLMAITDIARETGLSTASVSRFTRQFGFKGFYEFKDRIKDEVKSAINPVDRFFRLDTDLSGKKSLSKVARQDVKNINRLLSQMSEQVFTSLLHQVENASRVFVFGVGISSIFAHFLRYVFNQVQKDTHLLDERDISVEENILSVGEDDLIILLSFFPYSRSTVEFAQLARELDRPVVAISDNQHSPISEHVSSVVVIPRDNVLFTTSISAFAVLVNAIATEIALKNKESLTESLKRADRLLKRFYYSS